MVLFALLFICILMCPSHSIMAFPILCLLAALCMSDATLIDSLNMEVASNSPLRDGDVVTLELNLTSADPNTRTVHFFHNDIQQPFFFYALPSPTISFGFTMYQDDSIQLISADTLNQPTALHLPNEEGRPYTGDVDPDTFDDDDPFLGMCDFGIPFL